MVEVLVGRLTEEHTRCIQLILFIITKKAPPLSSALRYIYKEKGAITEAPGGHTFRVTGSRAYLPGDHSIASVFLLVNVDFGIQCLSVLVAGFPGVTVVLGALECIDALLVTVLVTDETSEVGLTALSAGSPV